MKSMLFSGSGLDIANNRSRLSLSGGAGANSGVFRLLFASLVLFLGFVGSVGAVPVTGCGTLSTAGETYVLQNDISTTGDCFTIGADNIMLDGAGYSITGGGSGFGVYLYGRSGVTIKNLTVSGFGNGIYLIVSSSNTITNNTASNNRYGIYLGSSSSNTLTDNTASNNNDGIFLHSSFGSSSYNNIITNNIASSNSNTGILLFYSGSNTIYNNFFNNTNNAGFTGTIYTNTWYTISTGPNIVGGPYIGGNFWANPSGTGFSETCIDAGGDGICDSSYTLASGNVDYSPLSLNFVPPTTTTTTTSTTTTTVPTTTTTSTTTTTTTTSSTTTSTTSTTTTSSTTSTTTSTTTTTTTTSTTTTLPDTTPPTIEIYTNETNYTTGDTMNVGLNITNPGNARTVGLYAWLDLPGGGKEWFLQEPSFALPAGLDYSNPAFMNFTLPSMLPGNYSWHAVLYDPAVSEIISESIETWTFEPKPSIEIYTNETNYTTGDTMNVGLNVTNPGNARTVGLYVWLDLLGGGKEWFIQEPSFTLPAGLDYSNPTFMNFTLPSMLPGNYSWHAVLYDPVVSEIISESIKPWTFSGTAKGSEEALEKILQKISSIDIDFAK